MDKALDLQSELKNLTMEAYDRGAEDALSSTIAAMEKISQEHPETTIFECIKMLEVFRDHGLEVIKSE